jgi:hypothetical protein
MVTWTGEEKPPEAPRGIFPERVASAAREEFSLSETMNGYAIYTRRQRQTSP